MCAFSLSNWLFEFRIPSTGIAKGRPGLQKLAQMPARNLPRFVRDCATAMKYLSLLGSWTGAVFPNVRINVLRRMLRRCLMPAWRPPTWSRSSST